ncbi:MAG: methylenetetrahydrofolate reductase [Candidatus Bipolaricaulota bacterium]
MKTQSNLERVLEEGKFAVTGELGPPTSANAEIVKQKAELLKGSVDAFNVTDGQTAVARMSSWAAGLIAKEAGLDNFIVQMTTRDRNRLALQIDILGVSALGVNNVVCLSGDHISFGNHPEARTVYDLDSVNFIDMVRGMRDDGVFQSGDEIDGPKPNLFIGAAANPFAYPLEVRPIRLEKKINAGVDFIQTQCLYNMEKFERWLDALEERGIQDKVYILAGITPIKSVGAARYMQSNVPGIDVPDAIVDRLSGVPKESRAQEGIKIAVETIQKVKEMDGVNGVHIMAIEWEEAVSEIVDRAEL